MARPLLLALRRACAGARITAVGPPALLELLAADGSWDESLPWPLPVRGRARLRSERMDAAFVLPPSFSSAWMAWRIGARVRIGFAAGGRSPLLTTAVRRPARGDLHLSREYLALAEALGIHAAFEDLPTLPVAESVATSTTIPAPLGPYAVLAPGAVYGAAKRWPIERFVALARELSNRGLRVLACGGAGEVELCSKLAAQGGAESLAGRTNLMQQAAVCASAAVVISNDSGMAHLAGAVGAPTVAVFGSTSSAWTAPLGPRVRVVQRATVCSPCFQRTCRVGYACLEAVPVSAVLDAIDQLGSTIEKGIA